MLIGERETFGIEFAIADTPLDEAQRKWVYGRLAFWVAGEQVGKLDAGASLRDAAAALAGLLRNKGNRAAPELMALAKEEVLSTIDAAMHANGEPADAAKSRLDRFARLLGVPPGCD